MSQVASGVDSLGESGERTTVRPSLPREKRAAFLHLYRSMLAASITDEIEIELVHGGEAFFHLGTQGHEGAAVLHLSLTEADWLFPHYRDKSLMLARGLTPAMFFHTLLCTAAAPSAGRQMIPFLGDASRRIMSLNIPVGNHALQAVGVASVVKDDPARPIVLCGLGDGTTQQGEVYEAIAEAVRSDLPVLFWIEDNGLSISTTTVGKTFFSLPGKKPYQFFGQPIHRLNGRDVVACHEEVEKIVSAMRVQRRPALVVFEVERLCNHTNADDERTYRPAAEIQAARQGGNPIHLLAGHLLRSGISRQELDQVAAEVRDQVREAADSARRMGDPKPVWHAKKPLPPEGMDPAREYRGTPEAPRLTMLEAMNQVLRRRLAEDPRVTLYGEDIEDPKGDVFGLTRGLTRAFPGRVINSALSEATILGVSIGRALAGARPVAMIQFADFLPQALNQIMSELGSMYWRTNGDWECPVLVLVACGGYRPGLGPFHAQTMEAIAAHVPGLDVFMPSTAADAAGLLNAAFDSGRPTIFFYPKVSLNDRERTTSADLERHWVPIGQARRVRQG
ncbi:MAG: transketolase, partial [Planctomycetes bacterium]|nr:transketolase [Planctomycetota bacterium]